MVVRMAQEKGKRKGKFFVVYVAGQAIYGETLEEATEEARKYSEGL